MKILSLHHILIPVSDVNAAANFYEAIGMVRGNSISATIPWMFFGDNQLHLWPTDTQHQYNGWRHEPSPHFAVMGDDIWEFAAEIPKLGGTILQEPKQRPNGSWYLFALDLDGNRFEVMQPLEEMIGADTIAR